MPVRTILHSTHLPWHWPSREGYRGPVSALPVSCHQGPALLLEETSFGQHSPYRPCSIFSVFVIYNSQSNYRHMFCAVWPWRQEMRTFERVSKRHHLKWRDTITRLEEDDAGLHDRRPFEENEQSRECVPQRRIAQES